MPESERPKGGSAKLSRLSRGAVIKGTYTIDSYLGSGAYGDVYKARHRYLGMQAIKIFHDGQISEENEGRLFKEAFILAKLNHRNVVRVFEANVDEVNGKRIHFIAMELVKGLSLQEVLATTVRLPIAHALDLAIDICSGLAAAHELDPPVVHRDVIPSNILVEKTPERLVAKVGDFGIAEFVDRHTRLTSAAGVIVYMPPEAFLGYELPASDVFSSGIVIFQLLTGTIPFSMRGIEHAKDESSLKKFVAESRRNPARKPSEFNRTIDAELDRIILRALNPKPEQRYPTGREFLGALRRYRPSLTASDESKD